MRYATSLLMDRVDKLRQPPASAFEVPLSPMPKFDEILHFIRSGGIVSYWLWHSIQTIKITPEGNGHGSAYGEPMWGQQPANGGNIELNSGKLTDWRYAGHRSGINVRFQIDTLPTNPPGHNRSA